MRRLILGVLVGVIGSASAFTIDLTDEEKAACAAEGGCAWVTKAWFIDQLENAHQQGFNEGLQKGKEDCHLGKRV